MTRGDTFNYVGSSNFAAWNIAQANERAATRGFLGLVSEQSTYSLAKRMVELEVVPACRAYGLGLMPYSPLAGGLLAGSHRPGSGGGRRERLKHSESQAQQMGSLKPCARSSERSPERWRLPGC